MAWLDALKTAKFLPSLSCLFSCSVSLWTVPVVTSPGLIISRQMKVMLEPLAATIWLRLIRSNDCSASFLLCVDSCFGDCCSNSSSGDSRLRSLRSLKCTPLGRQKVAEGEIPSAYSPRCLKIGVHYSFIY